VKLAIQRRSIFLAPPQDHDLEWLFPQFDSEEIWSMFGFDRSIRMRVLRAFRLKQIIVGIIHTVVPVKRVGFIVMFPPAPDAGFDFWEFAFAIPEAGDRDAYSALNSTDAMGHYLFDHVGVHATGWRVRIDNLASDAVVRRLGYKRYAEREIDGVRYTFYRVDKAGWLERRTRLESGEASHPSGIGGTFVVLDGPPYEPVVPNSGKSGG
jgi:hypothetical protein